MSRTAQARVFRSTQTSPNTGTVRDLTTVFGTAANQATYAAFAAAGSSGYRFSPGTAGTVAAPPSNGSPAAGMGWRDTDAENVFEPVTYAAGTWNIRLRLNKTIMTVNASVTVRTTIILYALNPGFASVEVGRTVVDTALPTVGAVVTVTTSFNTANPLVNNPDAKLHAEIYVENIVAGSPGPAVSAYTVAFVVDEASTNGSAFTAMPTYTIQFKRTQTMVGVGAAAKTEAADTFNRANSTTSIGTADTGQAWTTLRGTLGINTNAAYLVTSAGADLHNIASFESNAADVDISATISANPSAGAAVGIVYRVIDANNYRFFFHYLNSAGTAFLVYSGRVEAGVATHDPVSGTQSIASMATPFVLRVVCQGSTIKLYRNGIQMGADITSTFNQGVTKHGVLFTNTTTARIDNLTVVNASGGRRLASIKRIIAPITIGAAIKAITDTFNRADSATSLGTAGTGQSWEQLRGTFGISSNVAYLASFVAGEINLTAVDSGEADVDIFAQVTVNPPVDAWIGIVYRVQDANNFRYFFHYQTFNGFTVYSGRVQAGASTYDHLNATNLVASIATPVDLRVWCQGSTIRVYRNGVQMGSDFTSTFNQTMTKHGVLAANSSVPRLDNFAIVSNVLERKVRRLKGVTVATHGAMPTIVRKVGKSITATGIGLMTLPRKVAKTINFTAIGALTFINVISGTLKRTISAATHGAATVTRAVVARRTVVTATHGAASVVRRLIMARAITTATHGAITIQKMIRKTATFATHGAVVVAQRYFKVINFQAIGAAVVNRGLVIRREIVAVARGLNRNWIKLAFDKLPTGGGGGPVTTIIKKIFPVFDD